MATVGKENNYKEWQREVKIRSVAMLKGEQLFDGPNLEDETYGND